MLLSKQAVHKVDSISFPAGTEMVHFPASPPDKSGALHITERVTPFGNPGLITVFDTLPGLIAALHALHQPVVPRHPLRALTYLTALLLNFQSTKLESKRLRNS